MVILLEGHHRRAGGDQFADIGIDHYNLAVEGGGEILILEDGIHFFHAALGYVDHRGRGIAVLRLCAGLCELIAAPGGLLAGLGRVVGGLRLVSLLCADHALAIESLHAAPGFFGDVGGGAGLHPYLAGGVHYLRARTGVDLAVGGACHFLHGAGFVQLCVGKLRGDMDKRVAGLHLLSLFHIDCSHAARQLAADAYLRGLSLPLDRLGPLLDREEAHQCEREHHHDDDDYCGNQCLVLAGDFMRILESYCCVGVDLVLEIRVFCGQVLIAGLSLLRYIVLSHNE